VLARKPLSERTVAANVLRWGTGAINVDGCRIGYEDTQNAATNPLYRVQNNYRTKVGSDADGSSYSIKPDGGNVTANANGRWPANIVHDGSAEVVAAFPDVHGAGAARNGSSEPRESNHKNVTSWSMQSSTGDMFRIGDSGSAARFFYTSKADSDDRLGSKHPTVKPLDLMQWLVRLVTPPRGTCLDCFAGTGTLGEAAWREGMAAVLIEAEAEYQADIRRRMALALAGPDERQRESIKAKNLPYDPGPLFGGTDQQIDGRTVYADSDTWKEKAGSRPHVAGNAKPRDDGPLFAHVARETWAQMWAKPFDFSQEPKS
jgi:site-specific DNA-methyltransferase (adenine-specific)